MPKPTRMQMFTDVPEEIRAFSHYSIRPLLNGGWFISIRKVRQPVKAVIVKTKEELAALRQDLAEKGFVGVLADIDRSDSEPEPDDYVFCPPPNPKNNGKMTRRLWNFHADSLAIGDVKKRTKI